MKFDLQRINKISFGLSVFFTELNILGTMLRIDLGSILRLFLENLALSIILIVTLISAFLYDGRQIGVLIMLIIGPFIAFYAGTKYRFKINFVSSIIFIMMGFLFLQIILNNPIVDFFRVTNSPHPSWTGFSSEPSFFNEVLTSIFLLLIVIMKRPKALIFAFMVLFLLFLVTAKISFIQSILIILSSFMAVRACYYFKLKPKKMMILFIIAALIGIKTFYFFFEEVGIFFFEYFGSWRQIGNIIGIGQAELISFNYDYTQVVNDYVGDQFQYTWGSSGIYGYIISSFSSLSFYTSIFGILPTIFLVYFVGKKITKDGDFYTDGVFISCVILSMFIAPKWLMINFIILGYIYNLESQKSNARN